MTQPYSIIQAIRRPDKTTKKTQVRGETKSKGRRQTLGRNSMRQEKAETGMTRLDKKWPKLKRGEGPK